MLLVRSCVGLLGYRGVMVFYKPIFTQVSSARGVAKQRTSQFPACDIGIADGKTVPCIKTLGIDIWGINSNS